MLKECCVLIIIITIRFNMNEFIQESSTTTVMMNLTLRSLE